MPKDTGAAARAIVDARRDVAALADEPDGRAPAAEASAADAQLGVAVRDLVEQVAERAADREEAAPRRARPVAS